MDRRDATVGRRCAADTQAVRLFLAVGYEISTVADIDNPHCWRVHNCSVDLAGSED